MTQRYSVEKTLCGFEVYETDGCTSMEYVGQASSKAEIIQLIQSYEASPVFEGTLEELYKADI